MDVGVPGKLLSGDGAQHSPKTALLVRCRKSTQDAAALVVSSVVHEGSGGRKP